MTPTAAMGFGALPPEINSTLMYTGAGAGPLLAAASAWDGLGTELQAVAAGYNSVIANLTSEGWLGPASAAMAAAVAPYATWMSSTAVQAEQTANQMRAAVAAYETAHAATVPPPVVAANRAELITLVATNVLGQNTPKIAANWAEYYEMWAQDAAAMSGYSTSASAAAVLTPFSQPPQTTNGSGALAQGAATGNSSAGSVASHVQGLAASAQTLATPAGGPTGQEVLTELGSLAGVSSPKDALSYATMVPQNGSYIFSLANAFAGLARAFGGAGSAAGAMSAASSSAAGLGGLSSLGGFGSLASSVSAGLGQSGLVGSLSVPQAWASASPATATLASSFSSGLSSSLGTSTSGAHGLLNGMPMLANAAARGVGDNSPMVLPRFDARPSIIPISPAAG